MENCGVPIQEEVWKDLPSHLKLSHYQVSNLGRVKRKQPERILRGGSQQGYRVVSLMHDGESCHTKAFFVHRLVAFAFLDNPFAFPTVDHIDRNPENNNLHNLRWASYKDQCKNQKKRKRGTKVSRPILELDPVTKKMIRQWDSLTDVCRAKNLKLGFGEKEANTAALVYAIRRQHVYKGSVWEYFEKYKSDPTDAETQFVTAILPRSLEHIVHKLQVNKRGEVKFGNGRISNGSVDRKGYLFVVQKRRQIRVHRIVLTTFSGHPPDDTKVQVNHKDGNKQNNSLSNLEWVSGTENIQHRYALERAAGIRRGFKVIQKTLDGNYIRTFQNVAEASEALGVSNSTIGMAVKHGNREPVRKSGGGYKWEAVED